METFWSLLLAMLAVLCTLKDWVQGDWSDAHKMDYGSHMDQVIELKFVLYNLETLWF